MASKLTEKLLGDLERYLKGEMTGIELRMFEDKLKGDEELREELRLQIELSEALDNESDFSIFKEKLNRDEVDKLKTKLRSKEYQDLSASIRNAEKVYFSEKDKVRPFQKYYRYLAIAGVIILFFSIYFTQITSSYSSYYDEYVDWSTLPSFVEKGNLNAFSKGEIAFKKEDYKTAIEQFTQVQTTDELYIFSLQYLGASYDKLDENDKAIATFQKLADLNTSYESSKGSWYEAMMHLKMDNKEKAIYVLNTYIDNPNNFNYSEAKVLLRKLQ
ncbi:tetratricopeptide repeat protein [Kordia sp.]|uniref:tetratricopeptide repeat protein n=1 Tax=Kordia sp. TaxID=1965332 RepID=UPI003B5BFA33